MSAPAGTRPRRQRVDVWLYRARLVRTRAGAIRLIAEGGLRLVRGEVGRRLDKPSIEVGAGDALVLSLNGQVRTLRVCSLAARRGPPAEARGLYLDLASRDSAEA